MRGVGPGTVLGGRYTVRQRVEQVRGTERWTADDTTLGRSVSVLVIRADDHRTAGLLDAARRAASVTHAVFVRVLDVGTDGEVSFLVEEDPGEARTLGALVTDGGIPGDEVRRITGEVAAALESARQRGMHHLDLTPDDVLRTPEGDVRLRGLEVAAARAGEDVTDAEDAARRDAVGVVALAYAGLTGLWPLGAGSAGLGPAPRVSGGVASPSEIAAGVPRDLDALCRLTLNDDQGPTSPGDYARQVAPWPSRQVIGRPVTSAAPAPPADSAAGQTAEEAPIRESETATVAGTSADAGGSGHAGAVAGAAAAGLAAGAAGAAVGSRSAAAGPPPTRFTDSDRPTRPAVQEPTPPVAPAAREGGSSAGEPAPPSWLAGPTDDEDARVVRREPPPAWLAGPRGGAAAAGAGAAAGAAAGGGVGSLLGRDRTEDATGVDEADEPTQVRTPAGWFHDERAAEDGRDATNGRSLTPVPTASTDLAEAEEDEADEADEAHEGTASAGERLGATAGAAGAAVVGVLGSVGERFSGYARKAVDKVSELSPDTQRAEPPDGVDDLEAPAPMVPAEPLTKDESKLALAIVALFVVAALVIGIWGVSRIGSGTDIFGPAAPAATRTTTVTPSATGSQEASGGAAALEPLAILKVEAYDPEGDDHEHDELTGKVYDGNNDTGWYSESYSDSSFGGLKSGVGLIVDLGPNKKPQKVSLVIPNKSALEVYVGPDARLEGATKIGAKDPAQGTVDFDVPADVNGQYVIIWYTKVYPDGKGDIRAWLNEVVVSG